jgi:hypothetical protein
MSHTELRWARRRKIKSGMVSTSKVLQWRTIVAWQGYDDISKTPTPIYGDWQDVPTEDESCGDNDGR